MRTPGLAMSNSTKLMPLLPLRQNSVRLLTCLMAYTVFGSPGFSSISCHDPVCTWVKLVPPLVDFSTRICFALLPPDVVGKKK